MTTKLTQGVEDVWIVAFRDLTWVAARRNHGLSSRESIAGHTRCITLCRMCDAKPDVRQPLQSGLWRVESGALELPAHLSSATSGSAPVAQLD